MLFSTEAVASYVPTSSAQEFQFHILTTLVIFCVFPLAIPVGAKWESHCSFSLRVPSA